MLSSQTETEAIVARGAEARSRSGRRCRSARRRYDVTGHLGSGVFCSRNGTKVKAPVPIGIGAGGIGLCVECDADCSEGEAVVGCVAEVFVERDGVIVGVHEGAERGGLDDDGLGEPMFWQEVS